MSCKIAILTHEFDEFTERNSYLNNMAKLWQNRGLEVIVVAGVNSHVDADIAILHVNLTVVPDEYMEFAKRFPLVLNGTVRDISKRRLRANLVSTADSYDGPVVVKSNYNYGGVPEGRVARLSSHSYAHVNRPSFLYPGDELPSEARYVLVGSTSDLPPDVWDNPDLVVERFRPEKRESYYCSRMWLFLGDNEIQYACYSNDPIVIAGNITHREQLSEPVPPKLREIRKNLGFDFGKFDYVINNGEAVLFDVNRTPSLGRTTGSLAELIIKTLSDGIDTYL